MNIKTFLISYLITILFLSCSEDPKRVENKDNNVFNGSPVFTKLEFIQSELGDSMNTVDVSTKSYLEVFNKYSFYTDTTNDSLDFIIDKNRQEYYDIIDDYGYYMEVVRPLLESMKLTKVKLSTQGKFIRFITKNKKQYILKISDFSNRSGVIIFNTVNEPKFWEGEGGIESYFTDFYNK
jgi:hypothetical protein